MRKSTKILLAIGMFVIANTASAAFITGSIGFAGDYLHNGTTDLSDATAIDIVGNDAIVVGAVTGSFAAAGITQGNIAVYNDFTIGGVPIAGLWSIAGFSLDLTTMNVTQQTAATLGLQGVGVIKSTDPLLDDTNGFWSFTANQAGANFTFSSSTAVPEPSVVLLLGAGLLGMGFTRRMRKAA